MFIALIQAAQDSKAVISENSKTFFSIDPMGIGMTAIGMAVVFITFLFLYKRSLVVSAKRKDSESKKIKLGSTVKIFETSDDINAAIALAIHLFITQNHDNESMMPAVNKVGRSHSPWSSKIYGLRQLPR